MERISVSRGKDGRPKVEISYRFGRLGKAIADGVQDSDAFAKVHGRSGSEGLLRGQPRMSSCEVAAEREA